MNRQLRMGGGIMDVVPREPAILGGIKKAVKKVGKTVKKIAKSDIGKAALLYGATAGLGSIGSGQTGFARFAPSNFLGNVSRIGSFLTGGKLSPNLVDEVALTGKQNIFQKALGAVGLGGKGGTIGKFATLGLVSKYLTDTLGMPPEQAEAELARDPSGYLERYYRNLNPNASEEEVLEFVTSNTAEYSVGGRVGFAEGTDYEKEVQQLMAQGLSRPMAEFLATQGITTELKAEGGRIGFAEGMPKDEVIEDRGLPTLKTMPEFKGDEVKPRDMMMASAILGDESDDIAQQLFGKPVKQLNPEELKELMDYLDDLQKSFRAEGGRIGFANGPVLPPDPTQPVNPFGPKPGDFGIEEDIPIKTASYGYNEAMSDTFDMFLDMKKKGLIPPTMEFDEFLQEIVPEMGSKRIEETRGLAAIGGRMMKAIGDSPSMNAMQAAGVEGLPIRQNPKGVKELDLRETGGFIPPVGIKEKEDDIPAMLSNNEFVFTADAVRGMGDGNVNVGAQRMYDMMKKLEAGGRA